MKKRISLLLISSLFLTVAACNKNAEVENKYTDIKNVINKIENSSFKKEGFKINIDEKYNMESHIDNELEKVDYTYEYDGNGSFMIAYQSGDQGIEGITDLISSGTGYLNSLQLETIEYNYTELDKTDNQTKEESFKEDLVYGFDLLLYNNEAKFYTHSVKDDLLTNEKEEDEFGGKIAQNLLKTDDSTAIDNYMSEMIIMDGYYTVEEIEQYAIEKILSSKSMNNADFNKFVEDNKMKLVEGDSKIFLTFTINYADELKNEFEIDSFDNVLIEGSIGFDAETYELESYRYDLKDYFKSLLDGIDDKDSEETQTINIERFTVEGHAVKIGYEAVNFDAELTEFTDSQEFINNFISHALPKGKHTNPFSGEEE